MRHPTDDEIANFLMHVISDGFNRSLGALRKEGAIDCSEMERAHRGVGSKYYDLVPEEIEYTARAAAPALRERLVIDPSGGSPWSCDGGEST